MHDWEGALVFLSYVGGPDLAGLDNPYETVKGPVEGRFGVFRLQRVGPLGAMVQKPRRGEEGKVVFDPAVFIPWAAIHKMEALMSDRGSGEAES